MVADALGDPGLAHADPAARGMQPIEGVGQVAAAGAWHAIEQAQHLGAQGGETKTSQCTESGIRDSVECAVLSGHHHLALASLPQRHTKIPARGLEPTVKRCQRGAISNGRVEIQRVPAL